MSDQPTTIRALVAPMITHLAAAIPVRGRWTFTELLIGAAVTVGGHITDASVATSPTPLSPPATPAPGSPTSGSSSAPAGRGWRCGRRCWRC